MSLFLIYFEIGKPVTPSPITPPISSFPIPLTIKNRAGPTRPAFALTDGGSSAAFLAFGNKTLARHGDRLRQALHRHITERLNAGAHPHMTFLWYDGPIESASIDLDKKTSITPSELDNWLRSAKPLDLIEIHRGTNRTQGIHEDLAADSILIDIRLTEEGPDMAHMAPSLWVGTIDLLVGNDLIRINPPTGSIRIFPSLNTLGDAVIHLRQGIRPVEATLIGDTSPIHFEDNNTTKTTFIRYREHKTKFIEVSALDMACMDAIQRFLCDLKHRPHSTIANESELAHKWLGRANTAWPSLCQTRDNE